MLLLEGEVFVDQMVEDNIARGDVLALCNRVDVVRDEAREKKGRAYARGADVEVLLKDGRTLTKTVDNFLGSYQRPMSDEQMAVKFRRLAEKTLSPARTRELERVIRHLEATPSAANVIDLLRADAAMSTAS